MTASITVPAAGEHEAVRVAGGALAVAGAALLPGSSGSGRFAKRSIRGMEILDEALDSLT